jgi:hypothetical protein
MTCYILEARGGRHVAVPSVFPLSHQCTLAARHNRPSDGCPHHNECPRKEEMIFSLPRPTHAIEDHDNAIDPTGTVK